VNRLKIGLLVVCLFEVLCYQVANVEASPHRSKIISGSLTPSTLTAGATVTLSGSANATTTADASGNYSFRGVPPGAYTITPTKNGVSFQPLSQSITVNGSNMTVNFSATSMLQSISISAAAASVIAGSSDQFTAIGNFSDGSTQNLTSSVTWTSSNAAAATISSTGLATAVASGSSNIAAQKNGITSNIVTLSVTASTAALKSITVSAPKSSLALGSSETLTAMGSFSDGSTQNLTSSVSWTSSNPAAVSIATGALASAAGVGQSAISATQSGITGVVTISTTATISGTVSPAAGAAGTTITLSGAANATTNVDVNGNYSFTVLANGAYTVTPSKSLYSFSPSGTPISVNNASVTGENFTVNAGQLSMSPSSFSFGGVNVGSTAQIQATLSAAGGDVSVTSDTIAGSGFGVTGMALPLTVGSGKSVTFFATFTPTTTGSASATLSLSNNSTTFATANLSGTGAGLSITPMNLNFGGVLDGAVSAPQTLTLSAVGSSVTINSGSIVQSGAGGSAFTIAGLPSLPFTIPAGQSVQASVTFAPAAGSPGTAAGSIAFAGNINSVTPTLSGTGTPNVLLNWSADATPGVTYDVYRCAISATACIQSQPSNFAKVASNIGTLSFTDSTVSAGQIYYYALTAVDSSGMESSLSAVTSPGMIP
jgi:trimeric autotransporter adhesin